MSDQNEQQENHSQTDKTMRKRRILMKQKCNYIDHQITLNLQKLDSLMNILKDNEEQSQLITIKQLQESNTFQQGSEQNVTKKETKKQRKLKFKYSIFREYQFLQDNSQKLQSLTKKPNQQEIFISGLHQKLQASLQKVQSYTNDDTISQLSQSLKLPKLLSKISLKREQFFDVGRTESIRVETRYDWIKSYLERQFNDTIVKAISATGGDIQLLKFNQEQDQFECRFLTEHSEMKGKSSSLISINQSPSKSQLLSSNIYVNYQYRQFLNDNPEIEVFFPKHNQCISIIDPLRQQVAKVDLTKCQGEMRVLIKIRNKNENNMQRIMIFRELMTLSSTDQKYKIIWTKYGKEDFTEDIILQGGSKYIITNLCYNPSSQVFLILNYQNVDDAKIHKTKYDPWKSYNILCSSFQECSKVFMSLNVFDDEKPLQFLRSNFLDYGLVLEIYQNIYAERVTFLQSKQTSQEKVEDISLLFPEIYTELQNKNVYLPDELVIKFFQVTEKPARLYFPEKRVLIGSKIAENVTIHSTFK